MTSSYSINPNYNKSYNYTSIADSPLASDDEFMCLHLAIDLLTREEQRKVIHEQPVSEYTKYLSARKLGISSSSSSEIIIALVTNGDDTSEKIQALAKSLLSLGCVNAFKKEHVSTSDNKLHPLTPANPVERFSLEQISEVAKRANISNNTANELSKGFMRRLPAQSLEESKK